MGFQTHRSLALHGLWRFGFHLVWLSPKVICYFLICHSREGIHIFKVWLSSGKNIFTHFFCFKQKHCFVFFIQNCSLTFNSAMGFKQYGWFWYCWISEIISATFRHFEKLIKFVFCRKSGFPSSRKRILVWKCILRGVIFWSPTCCCFNFGYIHRV